MRRGVHSLVTAMAALCVTAAHAQQSAKPTIGFMHSQNADTFRQEIAAFEKGLEEQGLIAGGNVTIDYRWAGNAVRQLPRLASDLLSRKPAVLVAAGGDLSAQAAKAATSRVPIVFVVGADPVASGLAASLNRPGSNLTGVTLFTVDLDPKRLQLLRDMTPSAKRVALLAPKGYPRSGSNVTLADAAAKKLGLVPALHLVSNAGEIEEAFAQMASQLLDAILVIPNPLFSDQRDLLARLALRHRLPMVCPISDQARAGCLMSYGTKRPQSYRTAGVLTARIVKGEKPADLPVQQPTSFELVLNLRTAMALGLEFPATLLAIADEVIE